MLGTDGDIVSASASGVCEPNVDYVNTSVRRLGAATTNDWHRIHGADDCDQVDYVDVLSKP